jgi:hypothetical protein
LAYELPAASVPANGDQAGIRKCPSGACRAKQSFKIGGCPVRPLKNFQLNATRQLHAHRLKFGALFEIGKLYTNDAYSGTFGFDQDLTSGPIASTGVSSSSNGIASRLLGTGNAGSVPYNAQLAVTQHDYALYFHDTWRVNRRLSFSYACVARSRRRAQSVLTVSTAATSTPPTRSPMASITPLTVRQAFLTWVGQRSVLAASRLHPTRLRAGLQCRFPVPDC